MSLSKPYSEFRDKLINECLSWQNVPFRHMGRTKRGVDCLGFVMCVFQNIGYIAPTELNNLYSFNWHLGDISKCRRGFEKYCTEIDYKKRLVGDLCAFRVAHVDVNHMGIWLGKNEFIHASLLTGRSVQVSDIRHQSWNRMYIKSYRLKALKESFKIWAEEQQVSI